MSQGSSSPALPSRPVTVSEQQETLTPVSHVFGLSEVSTSLEALNIEVERKLTVVHHAQACYSPGVSMTPWSPNARDHRRSTQASPLKLKRYALQIWLKVEVGLATTNITNWKLEQQEDPVLYQVVKQRKASRETFKEALSKVTDRKAVLAYVKSKDQLVMKNGLLYQQSKQGQIQETVLQFIVPQIHRNAALDGCHWEAAHQGQSRSLSLMQEQFW